LVTAHWSEKTPTISNGEKHELYYDYGGFPPETYKIKYDAPGSPEVAREVFEVFEKSGLKPKMDPKRGWDHGVFVPMKVANPAADVPIVQLSVLSSEDPSAHFAMGQALSKLRDSNVAIIGSGFASLHSFRVMASGLTKDPAFIQRNVDWSKAVTNATLETSVEKRKTAFDGWREFPGAYEMHPRGGAEHFLPLIVCAGAGGEGKAKNYTDKFMGLDMYSYYWE